MGVGRRQDTGSRALCSASPGSDGKENRSPCQSRLLGCVYVNEAQGKACILVP